VASRSGVGTPYATDDPRAAAQLARAVHPVGSEGALTDSSQAVTVVNGQAWAHRPQHIGQLLATATSGAVIPDPTGLAASPDRFATVGDPGFWAGQPNALAEAWATSPDDASPIAKAPRDAGKPSVPAATTKVGRLALTVEEAAALLGISRSFA